MAADDYLRGIENERDRVRKWATDTKDKLGQLKPKANEDEWSKGYLACLEDLERELTR